MNATSQGAAAPVTMSDAARRRLARSQLVQEHFAKITHQAEETIVVEKEVQDQELVKPRPELKLFPETATRIQVVEARGNKRCRIVVDTPSGHSAGRIKIVMGFERIEREPVAPKAPHRTAAVRPKAAPQAAPDAVRETVSKVAVETDKVVVPRIEEPDKVVAPQKAARQMEEPQQSVSHRAEDGPARKPMPKSAPVTHAAAAPQSNIKATGPQRSSVPPPQTTVTKKPKVAQTQRVSIKPNQEATKPATGPRRQSKPKPAPPQNTTAEPKVPPPSSQKTAAKKVPPSHRGPAKPNVPPSHRGTALTNVPASQRVTAKRNNMSSQQKSQPKSRVSKAPTKDNKSLDGVSNATPDDRMESKDRRSPENQKKLYHNGQRKYAVEDLQRMFDEKKLKGPPLEAKTKNGVSEKKKKREPKKILKVFRA